MNLVTSHFILLLKTLNHAQVYRHSRTSGDPALGGHRPAFGGVLVLGSVLREGRPQAPDASHSGRSDAEKDEMKSRV